MANALKQNSRGQTFFNVVTPAQAGIQSAHVQFLDSGLRRNDGARSDVYPEVSSLAA